ncbi:hypothetical protein CAOG_03547 [Capsaspora owczarzaki ATCC 30864]|uniref:Nitrogen permease regulator 2 n=1 Tax=Capsaspora owczarzaki (strain ATCC 30864) TaxID=595528 RepID=A0A0D2WNG4_CAPO3|nr:hypothetical protein CAOG_03547 [Capsaspora owczarzaki ATCC 30864]KJE92625.1 hypothetical protein CAOG_003547 [Capsaspora owczarzaki ATCC 30864]|eukprot:XP_004348457.1 hypothetical protein CAOG_03547 [Capsaspora owczarzaki ATCC 30864]
MAAVAVAGGSPAGLPLIRAIFFAEFHFITGPKITYQVPEGFIGQDVFDAIHEYIITKPQLCDKLISINAAGFTFVGHPVAIENKKYERNALLFNLGFVFDAGVEIKAFEPTIRKIAHYLYSMEIESEFIYKPESKSRIATIIQQMYIELNADRYSVIPVDDANTFHLKVVPLLPDPADVPDHKVPIFIAERRRFASEAWDLTMQQILPHIDGINHVKRIAVLCDVDIELVRQCLQHLLYYGIIILIDIFQYGNRYSVTSLVSKLASSALLQHQCASFIMQCGAVPPNFPIIFSLYCKLSADLQYKDFCMDYNLNSFHIDERRFIQFGLIHQFIHTLHEYPVRTEPTREMDESMPTVPASILKYLDGKRNMDEICCALGRSRREVEDAISDDPFTLVIPK